MVTYGAAKGKIAAALGVSKGALINAEAYVAAAERYPELQAKDIPQHRAIAMAQTLDALPDEVRPAGARTIAFAACEHTGAACR